MLAGRRRSEVLLVHGGASGIGTMAIQLAHQLGARVAATAGSAEKLARCRELGADILVDYTTQDFVNEVLTATDGRGADVVLDNQGAAYLARNVEVLATSGRLVVIGLQGGRTAPLDLGMLMSKRAAILSTSLRARPVVEKAAIVASVQEHVWPLLASGAVRPVIHARFPMEQAADAHRLIEASGHIGKVLLIAPSAG
jgi:NADPH:quinone reductase-like Zn-dependent oxidoreductase